MIPKERKCLLLLLAALLPSLAFARTEGRKVLDRSKIEVVYQLKERVARAEEGKSETNNYFTILSAGERVARFEDYALYQKDSLEQLSSPADEETLRKYRSKLNRSTHYFDPVIVQKLEDPEIHVTDIMVIDYYSYVEGMPSWELEDDEPKTIAGYSCKKATLGYGGRVWHAWYAEELPLQYGPWKLCNLPGLILRAESEDGEFVFEAIVIRSAEGDILDTGHLRTERTKREIFVKKKNEIYTGGRMLDLLPPSAIASVTIFKEEDGLNTYIINGVRLRDPRAKYLPIER